MIYRMILATFGFAGISEISHCFPFEKGHFVPTDPEFALLVGGQIDEKEFGEIFFRRIQNANEICCKNNKQLLIREHTHSYYFFDSGKLSVPDHPSWIADQYAKRLEKSLKCIVTVRDPIDSWLSLSANFPHLSPTNFAAYCSHYKNFLGSITDNYDSQTMLLIKYEDVVEDQARELNKIAQFIGETFSGSLPEDWYCVASTGNSGRQSSIVQKRARRPFGTELIRGAEESEDYSYLVDYLEYPHLRQSVSTAILIRAFIVELKQKLLSVILRK